MKILIAEPLAPAAVDLLRAQPGWDVVVSDPKSYSPHLADCEALLVRSAVKVNRDVLKQAPKLRVIGRAGVGVDNVDLPAATEAGVLVMNTPGGNAVSVAEHTLALMLSLARYIPQASASIKAGKWEKKKFLGNELRGKTLGIVGFGAIGREVARRAKAFEMKLLAYDPYVSSAAAADLGVELKTLDELYAVSDYLTLHVALTPETDHLLNATAFAKMKSGIRIVNCARGELIDEAALAEAIQQGKVSGAALDVFEKEPPTAEDAAIKLDAVVATPHIAGSTEEAQEIVGVRIVEQMVEYLKSGVALNAVNMPAISAEQYRVLGPYVDLAERLGIFIGNIATGNPITVRFIYSGKLADSNTQILRNAGVAGILSRSLEHRANIVNAMQIATDRGYKVIEQREPGAGLDTIRVELETEAGKFTAAGSVVLDKPRLMQVKDISCEVTLDGNLMYSVNEDVPGVIGFLGTVLGRNGVNIANFALGRQDGTGHRTAISIVETDEPVPESVIEQLFENKAVKYVRSVTFPRTA